MKKCNRCKIVFHDDERSRCLYCDTNLLTVKYDDTVGFRDDKDFDPNLIGNDIKRGVSFLKDILSQWEVGEYLRAQYVVGTYFKVRTFAFSYSFSRHHYKMGRNYKRMWISPLNITSVLIIPWVIVNILDSFYMRLTYNAYCSKCGWKFKQVHATQVHDVEECTYNQEYSKIVNEILNGSVYKTEGQIKEVAYHKVSTGKKSAYKDLCSRRSELAWIGDVLCIWVSILIVMGVIIAILMPLFLRFGIFMTSDSGE